MSIELAPVYIALLHHSILDKHEQVVTTAITNMDIHDISRSAHTYGIQGYYLINPEKEQQRVATRIIEHWKQGGGKSYNPLRAKAFQNTQIVSWLGDVLRDIKEKEKKSPFVVMTSARTIQKANHTGYEEIRKLVFSSPRPLLLVFGTGWGMEERLLREADALLPPIRPKKDSTYLHLSVRSAVAIVLDRLLGDNGAPTR